MGFNKQVERLGLIYFGIVRDELAGNPAPDDR